MCGVIFFIYAVIHVVDIFKIGAIIIISARARTMSASDVVRLLAEKRNRAEAGSVFKAYRVTLPRVFCMRQPQEPMGEPH